MPKNPNNEEAGAKSAEGKRVSGSATYSPAEAYQHTATSALWSILWLRSAENVFLRTQILLIEKHGTALGDPIGTLLKDMKQFVESKGQNSDTLPLAVQFHWFKAVTVLGYFVYATTIFDSFLSDTTRFLLLTNLASMGADCRVPIAVVTKPAARAKVVNEEVSRKVRSLASHNGFGRRLGFLQTRFKLKVDISQHKEPLDRFSDLRNSLVHDSSLFGFALDESDRNKVVMKRQFGDPSEINEKDLDEAIETYRAVILEIYRAVRRDVLRCPEDDGVTALYGRSRASEATAADSQFTPARRSSSPD